VAAGESRDGGEEGRGDEERLDSMTLPKLEVMLDVELLHPLLVGEGGGVVFARNPKECEF